MADARRRRSEYWASLAAVVAAAIVMSFRTWPVPPLPVAEESALNALLLDRALIGVLRLAIVVVALYGIASVPALVVGGRWAKGLGTGGVLADDAGTDVAQALQHARQQVADLQLRNARLTRERDDWASLVDARTRPD
ncbi:MAG: hypothetical protein M3279_03180 [Actinomycetota bacterium]|nr:hypothetical protein [Actinomycetota bacterium]